MSEVKTITVPDIGDFDSVDVIEILVSVGDQINAEDSLITLESDKATMDIPSPYAGTVKEIKIKVGDKIKQDDVMLLLETDELPKASEEKNQSSSNASPACTIEKVLVPDIGDFDSVDVIEVLVAEGDSVNTEDSLITLESDKATMDIPAPQAGIIKQIKIKTGDKIAQGDLILTMEVNQPSGNKTATQQHTETQTQTPQAPAKQSARQKSPAHIQQSAPPAQLPRINEAGFIKAHASPSVRKFARELGVDLSRVRGSGRKQRILKEDVQAYVKSVLTSGAAASPGLYVADLPEVDFKKFGEIEIQPLSKINKLTGKFLHRSWFYIPHVTQFDEADITEMDAVRKDLNEQYKDQGIKITFLAFLLKAVVKTLQEFPRFNASLDNDQENLILKKYFHIGVAVDTLDGLLVPVMRDVDQKSLTDIAQEIVDIAARAREKKITPAEMQGACFTISSLGGIGGTAFTPIVNQPEVAILGVSKTTVKPVYQNNEFVPRKMLPLSLSYDHRVIDGVAAAKFTSFLANILADANALVE